MSSDPRLVRVEKGEASPEELAAVTALLVARAARQDAEPTAADRSTAGWRRLERSAGYRAPHSWQG
ncbi:MULTISPECIES: acyl-CoA carboxylase subunit epsilon [unclassified Streptomyces]|uniref:Acyl-CoA carboxylase subunit epsilon n=1 Tax=Streptomyces millisiae TaxID=3075542 RepID=A0ABU2LYG4_9ACTN|nr:acyl-CoA carboxylase subunit epsilon [Streptomyces sp. DSM 44918]MDT0322637.1 acyl-CoA carboxylase subunit epsilon [Streptomyces sp. DSM 44918]